MTEIELLRWAPVGSIVKFHEERNPYRVRATFDNWVILTKPFAPRKTVIYTIVDFKRLVRGPDNMIFGRGYESDDDCASRLFELVNGDIEVSWRYSRHEILNVDYVKFRSIPPSAS